MCTTRVQVDWVLSPLSDCTQAGLGASFQRQSSNWACEHEKDTALGIRKPGFLPQPCHYPIAWPWKLISSSLGFDIPISRMGIGSDFSRIFHSETFILLAQSVSTALALMKALSAQRLTQERESTWTLLEECELSIFLKAVEFPEIFPRWYLLSLRFHKLFHLCTLTYTWAVLKSNHEYEVQP